MSDRRCRFCTGRHADDQECNRNSANIYALVDPRNGQYRYIGRTIDNLDARLKGHLWDRDFDPNGSGRQKLAWLIELKKEGFDPKICLLEIVDIRDLEAEQRWLIKLTAEGANLTNAQFFPSKAHFQKEVQKYRLIHSWDVASFEAKLSLLKNALIDANGSITEAAKTMRLTRQQVTNLVRQFKLKDFAAQLRIQHGGVRVQSGERKGIVLGRAQKPIVPNDLKNDK